MANPLQLLSQSVVPSLEAGVKGSKFPIFHGYVGGEKDLPPEKIRGLLAEIQQIYDAFMAGSLRLVAEKVEVMVPVHDTGYVPELGVPVDKDSQEVIGHLLNSALDQCELALLAGCGFGKFSPNPEAIAAALKQLQQKPVEFIAPLPSGATVVRIVAFDANNKPDHGLLVDGLWNPYLAIGLVSLRDGVLAFRAKMDYRTSQWAVERCDSDFLQELLPNLPVLPETYQTLTGQKFDPGKPQVVDPEIIRQLQASPHFQQVLNRVCSRWLI